MAELAGIVISADTLLILGAYIFFTGIIIYFYRFSNKRLMKKIMELKRKEKGMYSLIEKINAARVREHKEAGKRLDALEEKAMRKSLKGKRCCCAATGERLQLKQIGF